MTRKQFQLIADVLHKARPNGELDQWHLAQKQMIDRLSEAFADALKETNPHFNKSKFLKAAGFIQE